MIKSTKHMLRMCTVAALLFGTVAASGRALAAIDHYEIQVDGLACPFCAYGLEKKLKRLPGITDVHIELKTGRASFDVSSGVLLPEPVQEAVHDAGFTPRDITVTASGTVQSEGEALQLDVGADQVLALRGGQAFAKLRALVKEGHRNVVVTGLIHRVDDTWQLSVATVTQR